MVSLGPLFAAGNYLEYLNLLASLCSEILKCLKKGALGAHI